MTDLPSEEAQQAHARLVLAALAERGIPNAFVNGARVIDLRVDEVAILLGLPPTPTTPLAVTGECADREHRRELGRHGFAVHHHSKSGSCFKHKPLGYYCSGCAADMVLVTGTP